MKIISVVSAKGGVGKTSVAANLSTALRHAGHDVLAVDLDPQNALQLHFGGDPHRIEGTSRATLAHRGWTEVGFTAGSGVRVLPYGAVNESDRQMFETHLENHPDWLRSHLDALEPGPDTLVVIDTPPGPSVYMRVALSAASLVLVVSLPDAASYATLPMMEGLVATYCQPRQDFIDHAFVINQIDNAKLLSRDVTQVMRADFTHRVTGLIHQDQSVCEALAFGQSVLEYDPHCQATRDYLACAEDVAARLRLSGSPP